MRAKLCVKLEKGEITREQKEAYEKKNKMKKIKQALMASEDMNQGIYEDVYQVW